MSKKVNNSIFINNFTEQLKFNISNIIKLQLGVKIKRKILRNKKFINKYF